MTMHHLLIDLTAKTRKLNITTELEAWLLSEYGWEPAVDLWNPSELMDYIEIHCKQYWNGDLDITLPDAATLWENRAKNTAYILQGILLERDHLSDECCRLMKLLEDNGISY